MTVPSEAFVDAAIGAINAVRLFAHNTRLPETTFEASMDATTVTIAYKAAQSHGKLTRTKLGVFISVEPVEGIGGPFEPCEVIFPIGNFAKSWIMTERSIFMLNDQGRPYCRRFAEIFDLHQTAFTLTPFHFADEDHLVMSRPQQPSDFELHDDVDAIAQAIGPAIQDDGASILITHACMDLPGGIRLLNSSDHEMPLPKPGKLRDRLDELDAAAKKMAPQLRFNALGSSTLPRYTARPHAFTLEMPEDVSRAKTRAITAAARIAVSQRKTDILGTFQVTLVCKKPVSDPIAFATDFLIEDWSLTTGEGRPEILTQTIERESAMEVAVALTLSADKDAVSRYNGEGEFLLLPL